MLPTAAFDKTDFLNATFRSNTPAGPSQHPASAFVSRRWVCEMAGMEQKRPFWSPPRARQTILAPEAISKAPDVTSKPADTTIAPNLITGTSTGIPTRIMNAIPTTIGKKSAIQSA